MKQELELYIHIPLCIKKCNYCDFLSFPQPAEMYSRYAEQLIKELKAASADYTEYEVRSVFIGGGTPSLLSENLITAIMETVYVSYHVAKEAEVTIECNPGSTLRHKFAAYRRAGINRLSIGLQSADNAELKMLGRVHSFEEFLKSYQSARMEGFRNINIDLINCIPMQSLKTWKKTLRTVLMLKPEHVSVYNLIIEEGTPFYEMQREGLLMMPSEEEQSEIDDFTKEYLAKQGYRRYEISNWAKEGMECRHNCGYWTGVPYLGFGLGAASCFNKKRWNNTSDLQEYLDLDFVSELSAASRWSTARARARMEAALKRSAANAAGADSAESMTHADGTTEEMPLSVWDRLRKSVHRLSREERMEEYMFLGLRMTDGISTTGFLSEFGQHLDSVYGKIIDKNIISGLMESVGGRIRLTGRGMDVSNVVLSDFLFDREETQAEDPESAENTSEAENEA